MSTDLETRLRALEDHLALHRLLNAFQRLSDMGEYEAWSQCWTEDAAVPKLDGVTMMVGRAAIRDSAALAMSQYQGRQHLLGNSEFQIDGDQATGVSNLYFIGTPDVARPERHVAFGGHYTWRFQRTADGWKIAGRTIDIQWRRPMPD